MIQPQHLFRDTGYLDVSLISGFNGCYDTLTIDSAIHVKGPIAKIRHKIDCETPNSVSFKPKTIGGTSHVWDFGDGSPLDSVNWRTTHLFPPVDSNYKVTLTVYDSITQCEYISKATVKIRFLKGNLIASDSIVCGGDQLTLHTNTSDNAMSSVLWAVDTWSSLTKKSTSNTLTFNQKGKYKIYAIVKDINNCFDTLVHHLSVYNPTAKITMDTNWGCAPLQVNFFDASMSDTNIVSCLWNFGDGGTSVLENPSHSFITNKDQKFKISLLVTDVFGCTGLSKGVKSVQVKRPSAFFYFEDNELCVQDTLQILGLNVNDSLYNWNFGDGSSSSQIAPQKTYVNGGTFPVILEVTDHYGCIGVYSPIDSIKVHDLPDSQFSANDTSMSCYPSSVIFTNTNMYNNGWSWEWSFGDGSPLILTSNPLVQHSYLTPGEYDVSLVVTTSFGCSSSLQLNQYIDINGPIAEIVLDDYFGCTNENFAFGVGNVNQVAHNFNWDFGDGITNSVIKQNKPIYHSYNYGSHYTVTLLASDDQGLCVKSDQVYVGVTEVTAKFSVSDTAGCPPLIANLVNKSIGSGSQIWRVGKNENYVSANLDLNLLNTGVYNVQLEVWNDTLHCRDTVSKKIEVYSLPVLNGGNDTSICIGDQISLFADGAGQL